MSKTTFAALRRSLFTNLSRGIILYKYLAGKAEIFWRA